MCVLGITVNGARLAVAAVTAAAAALGLSAMSHTLPIVTQPQLLGHATIPLATLPYDMGAYVLDMEPCH